MLDWRVIVPLGCASLALGALTPWAMPTRDPAPASSSYVLLERPSEPGPRTPAPSAPAPRLRGVVAIGDAALLEARPCLEERGVRVHPKTVDTPDELLAVLDDVMADHAAVLIHIGTRAGLVDGQIRAVVASVSPGRRVVWATIRAPDAGSGNFSFEDRTNASIRNVVGRHSEGRVLDWRAKSAKHPEWTVADTGMSSEGCREYAAKVIKLSGVSRGA